ncbi:Helix-turn-helix domain-containing protein [Marinobacter sp. LV10R510-11A]|uniref:helix-turn-helix domain-containing protein n=1 Tax=Marinobacter sp. LV10R510-11A TaxID=1415568 RepID=UPI000BB7484E|nr:helix-turn-helix domain-containing protein [Marinobacter sp. LV10R510-11A]SOB74775.1 Helix-turn-helix domain-containing protein [Marinobacter sp. LV10R510-11A]
MSYSAEQRGEQIRARRKALGYKTQQALADETGVLRKRVNEMENGRYTGRITDLYRVLATLGLEISFEVISRPTLDDLSTLFPSEDDD